MLADHYLYLALTVVLLVTLAEALVGFFGADSDNKRDSLANLGIYAGSIIIDRLITNTFNAFTTGGVFIFWDRLFDTYQPEEEKPTYGLVKPITLHNPIGKTGDRRFESSCAIRVGARSWRERKKLKLPIRSAV